MKILIVDSYYPKFLAHALQRIDTQNLGYRAMLDQVLRLRFGTADFYSRNLRALGHDADDIIFNCEPLQRRWSEEFGVPVGAGLRIPTRVARLPFLRSRVSANSSLLEIALRQIRHFRPDVLYMQGLELIPPKVLRSLKDSAKLIVGQIASPLPADEFVQAFDLILTSFPHFVDKFRRMGVESEYFRIGFDPIVLDELGPVPRTRACTFVGGLSAAHAGRTKFLEELARSCDMEFFGYGADTLDPASPILPRHRGDAWAMDMYRALAESRITVNVHIDVAENYANNMRLYEATGCGALLVNDMKDNLHELFTLDKEVVTYRSPGEAVEKIRWYIDHPQEAEAIALAGHQRTLREHSYRHRMEELDAILRPYLRGEQ